MRLREIEDQRRRTLVVACDKGDRVPDVLLDAVREHGIRAAQVTAVGGLRRAELGYFDRGRHDYLRIPVDEQVEVLSLLGDVAQAGDETQLHLHAVLGRRDGSTVGGHLLGGEVWPTLEVIVTEVGPELAKRVDRETGLALLSP
ncbi:PPC domain-containing DNA-binding protein [Micromonospora sp. NPDC049559]|uniref:PPC domain-containing DNA-binding protein n=1 Tax=Micromonospora sp. NPDC049559 TaxID=3155923 RepID=UPI0034344601